MDVASLVKNITSCFEDAASLVRRIRDKENVNESAMTELLSSLELGPIVVNGYYRSDAKRFGDSYTAGDALATDQLKDVLIHLQMTVLTTLSTVLMLDKDLDYAAIQTASDDCRVNAGVSLGQLSQRLADPSRAPQHSNHTTTFPFALAIPPLKYSQSMSSSSSEGPRTPTTPELEAAMMDLDYPGRLPGFVRRAGSSAKAMAILQGSPNSPQRNHVRGSTYSGLSAWERRKTSLDDTAPYSQPSSILSTDEPSHLSPVSPVVTSDQWGRPPRPSSDSSNAMNVTDTAQKLAAVTVQERFGPDDYSDVKQPSYQIKPVGNHHQRHYSVAGYHVDPPPPLADVHPLHRKRSVSRGRTHVPNQHIPTNVLALRSSTSINGLIPVSTEDVPPMPTPPLPSKSPHRRASAIPPLRPGARKILGDIDPVIDAWVNTPVMPTESNMMGYCKGAFRLQIGLEKKAFSAAQKPAGIMGMLPYWKCEKCYFEGPLKLVMGPNKKPEKVFDPNVREHEGIRFKWAFLAKCHVPMKFSATCPDGFAGSFGCIFCTAEGKERNWNISGMSSNGKGRKNSTLSTNSRGNDDGSKSATPIFGNPATFMEHLQFHRQTKYWPNREMQKKMKCIVGRVAEPGEDFDINFMPIEAEMEA